jgi:hypothetical protein
MRIKQVSGQSLLTEEARKRLEAIVFHNADTARHDLERYFPNHIVSNEAGRLRIAVRDKTFFIAEFKEIL